MHALYIMLVNDLQLVLLCFTVLMLAMGANMVLSLYYHIEIFFHFDCFRSIFLM